MTAPTVKYQISAKAPDGTIVLAAAEGADAGTAYNLFRAATEDLGLTAALLRIAANPMEVAVANASPLTQAMAAPEPEPWGYPPVPPQVPAAVHQPAPAAAPQAPVCQHGPKSYQSGVSAKGPWQFWGCNAKSEDPTKCPKEWIR